MEVVRLVAGIVNVYVHGPALAGISLETIVVPPALPMLPPEPMPPVTGGRGGAGVSKLMTVTASVTPSPHPSLEITTEPPAGTLVADSVKML